MMSTKASIAFSIAETLVGLTCGGLGVLWGQPLTALMGGVALTSGVSYLIWTWRSRGARADERAALERRIRSIAMDELLPGLFLAFNAGRRSVGGRTTVDPKNEWFQAALQRCLRSSGDLDA